MGMVGWRFPKTFFGHIMRVIVFSGPLTYGNFHSSNSEMILRELAGVGRDGLQPNRTMNTAVTVSGRIEGM